MEKDFGFATLEWQPLNLFLSNKKYKSMKKKGQSVMGLSVWNWVWWINGVPAGSNGSNGVMPIVGLPRAPGCCGIVGLR